MKINFLRGNQYTFLQLKLNFQNQAFQNQANKVGRQMNLNTNNFKISYIISYFIHISISKLISIVYVHNQENIFKRIL